jgi:salicylate hydroxylase
VAVVGGGIGGLTLAIALRRMGVEVEVFEQAPELGEIGAAVALSANATRLLQRLGVYHQLSAKAAEPTELQFRRWDSGELIWSHPVGQWYRERCGGPSTEFTAKTCSARSLTVWVRGSSAWATSSSTWRKGRTGRG